jgi:ribosome-binding protein aMBF1 (putative translation factor)
VSNVVNILKEQIHRLAKKEAQAQVAKAWKVATEYRREIVQLKRLLHQRAREIAYLRKRRPNPADDDPLAGVRFSAKSVRSQRRRLGLSADDYAKLVGVSPLTIHHWEQEKARPRKAQLVALVAVRGIGKREALKRLAKLNAAKR